MRESPPDDNGPGETRSRIRRWLTNFTPGGTGSRETDFKYVTPATAALVIRPFSATARRKNIIITVGDELNRACATAGLWRWKLLFLIKRTRYLRRAIRHVLSVASLLVDYNRRNSARAGKRLDVRVHIKWVKKQKSIDRVNCPADGSKKERITTSLSIIGRMENRIQSILLTSPSRTIGYLISLLISVV